MLLLTHAGLPQLYLMGSVSGKMVNLSRRLGAPSSPRPLPR